MSKLHHNDRDRRHPPPAMARLPERRLLAYYWWRGEFATGTTLLWRDQVRAKRAGLRRSGRLKHDPDRRIAKERRHVAVSLFNWMTAETEDPLPGRLFVATFGDLGTSSLH